jgi:hypothetical protein
MCLCFVNVCLVSFYVLRIRGSCEWLAEHAQRNGPCVDMHMYRTENM